MPNDPAQPNRPGLDNTSGCGQPGPRCECCGDLGDIRIITAATPLGVLCLSACPRCAAADTAPPITVHTAARFVRQHAAHLGIDLDQMADALAAERDGQR